MVGIDDTVVALGRLNKSFTAGHLFYRTLVALILLSEDQSECDNQGGRNLVEKLIILDPESLKRELLNRLYN